MLVALQKNPGQTTPFFASVATLAVLALPLRIALARTFILVIIELRDQKSLEMQLIFIGKWRHRRLDYRFAQANEPVKDPQRGEADSLTGTGGCATRQTARNSPVNPGTLPSGIPEIVVIY